MKTILVIDNSLSLFQAGEDVGHIWENYQNTKGNFHKDSLAVFQRYGTSYPANGCGHCEHPDCFLKEFIRNYWDFPHSD